MKNNRGALDVFKKIKQILPWILGIIFFFWLYNNNWAPETKGVMAMVIFLYFNVENNYREQNKRFRYIENKLGLLDDPTSSERKLQIPSYKLNILITPHWFEIMQKLANGNVGDTNKFIENIKNNKNLNIDEKKSLIWKSFNFICFYDRISGLRQIWSEHDKSFIDNIEVRGKIFEVDHSSQINFRTKYRDNNIKDTLVITPEFIGFHTILPDGDVIDDDKLSKMPFNEIINFLLDLYKEDVGLWGPMYKIKKFPQKLTLKFEQNKIKYDDSQWEDYGCGGDPEEKLVNSEWAKKNNIEIYNQKMKEQIFSSPYYDIWIKIETF